MRGATSKEQVYSVLQKVFGDQLFKVGKEIRLNWKEDGAPLQLKISFTAAKDIVGGGAFESQTQSVDALATPASLDLTPEEIKEVRDLIAELGL